MRLERATAIQILKGCALLVLIFGTYLVAHWLDLGEQLNPEGIVSYLNGTGPFAPLVFMLLMAAAVVISPIPSLPLDLAAGASFGVAMGTTYAVPGAEIGAILSFLIGRFLGRETLTRILRMEITFCERCSDRHLAGLVFLSRLLPIFSFDLVSYGAGLTNMSLKAFAVATLLGMILPTFALTSLGRQLVFSEWPLMVLGAALATFLFLLPTLVVRYSSSRWVALLRGGLPVPASEAVVTETTLHAPCASCGEPLPTVLAERRMP